MGKKGGEEQGLTEKGGFGLCFAGGNKKKWSSVMVKGNTRGSQGEVRQRRRRILARIFYVRGERKRPDAHGRINRTESGGKAS